MRERGAGAACENAKTKKRRTHQTMGEKRVALSSEGSGSRRIGSKGATDELGAHFSCSGVIPSELEVQSLVKGPPGILTGCSEAERAQFSRFLSHTAGGVPDLDGASWPRR